ncbi:MAG: L,D-transpeptidase family protein [Gammaproteobacteria bacterium]|nr:L,D-transpeptidase family protein [Gammaproteobacteria bacterium]
MMRAMFTGKSQRRGGLRWRTSAVIFAMIVSTGQLSIARAQPDPEQALVLALIESRQGSSDKALQMLRPLLNRQPPFRVAELLYGDLTRELAGDTSLANVDEQLELERADLLAEAEARLAGYLDLHNSVWYVPDALLHASDEQRYIVAIDLTLSRLFLFENVQGAFELRAHYYVSLGKNGAYKQTQGDRRTPVGVYFLTGRIADADLPEFYGAGALPVNYPNEWDLRHQRTGYGIWLHGVPRDTYSRAPQTSDGCLVLSNDLFRELWVRLEPVVTPIVVYDRIEWVPQAQTTARRDALLAAVETWRSDWESRDDARYARHYAKEFRSGRYSREPWLRHKAQVNAAKRYIEVELHDLNAYGYPGEDNLAVVTFQQVYRSSNYDWTGRKRQYWRNVAGQWQIVFEGDARILPIHERGIPASARIAAALF